MLGSVAFSANAWHVVLPTGNVTSRKSSVHPRVNIRWLQMFCSINVDIASTLCINPRPADGAGLMIARHVLRLFLQPIAADRLVATWPATPATLHARKHVDHWFTNNMSSGLPGRAMSHNEAG